MATALDSPHVPDRSGALIVEKQDLRERQCFRVGDGEQGPGGPERLEASRRAARQPQLRRPALPEHFDVFPQHAARVAGAQRFHRRFLRRETAREARYRIALARTISNLDVGEHAPQEPLTVPCEYLANPREIGGVDTETDDGHI